MAEGAWEEHEQLRGGRWVEDKSRLSIVPRVLLYLNISKDGIIEENVLHKWGPRHRTHPIYPGGGGKERKIRKENVWKTEKKKGKLDIARNETRKKISRIPSGLRVGILTSLTGSVNFFVSQLTFLPVTRETRGTTRMKAPRLSHRREEWSSWSTPEVIWWHCIMTSSRSCDCLLRVVQNRKCPAGRHENCRFIALVWESERKHWTSR